MEDATAKQNNTAKGVILGTVNYMSPEQAKGERVDERTDIFSLGILIYEMIAGRTPFAGNSMLETFANLINAEPLPLFERDAYLNRIRQTPEFVQFMTEMKAQNERYRREFT